jgi:hypothetical protein
MTLGQIFSLSIHRALATAYSPCEDSPPVETASGWTSIAARFGIAEAGDFGRGPD